MLLLQMLVFLFRHFYRSQIESVLDELMNGSPSVWLIRVTLIILSGRLVTVIPSSFVRFLKD